MDYKQNRTIDDFYDSSYNDPEKFDTKSPATEYKWKGKMNHLSSNVAQKLKSFVRWMTHEGRPYELHDLPQIQTHGHPILFSMTTISS